jgi:Beta-fructosidases (levanase/invertase)
MKAKSRSKSWAFAAVLSCIMAVASVASVTANPGTGWTPKAAASAGIQAESAPSTFVSATNVDTNLTNWQVKGRGHLDNTKEGLLLTSEPKENVMAISGVVSDNFVYEADVKVTDMKADATLVFRSNEDGWASYMLQIVPAAGLIRLRDAASDAALKEERQVELQAGEIYHLKVIANGSSLRVYWNGQYKPVIDMNDTAYAKGLLGLNVWDGSALFQNIRVSELKSNLGTAISTAGIWEPDLKGWQGTAADKTAVQVYSQQAADFVYEGDISFDAGHSEAALAFRMNKAGTQGYLASLTKDSNGIVARLKRMDGTVIAASKRVYPTQNGSKHHLEIAASGRQITLYVDGYADPAVQAADSSYSQGNAALAVMKGSGYFQNVYMVPASKYYTENYRPDYHYSPARGSASDPNGLVYYEGEYHLFHQDGGTWAHAVSDDLVHWKRLPIALPWNDNGHVWSGSAVADLNNASGLFTQSGGSGLIAYYTSYNPDGYNGNQRIGLAYSTDQGRTWQYSSEHPILIENPGKQGDDPGGWDFRDPKVVRDEANHRWIMVVSGGDHIRFFTSTNLIEWTHTDSFGYGSYVRGGVWECPDLFELPVEGTREKKWVLMISTGANPSTEGSDAEYFVGQLTAEGKFVNDNAPGKVLRTDYGKEFYASMSFSDLPDNRRIMLAWMTNWDYPFAFPTDGWKGELTIPRELALTNTSDGVRLVQAPVQELQSLRTTMYTAQNKTVTSNSANLLKNLSAGAFEIEADIEVKAGSAVTEFGFNVREGAGGSKTVAGYRIADHHMFIDRSHSGVTDFSSKFSTYQEAPLKQAAKRVKMTIFVDESSIELFGNDGEVVFSDVIFPDPASRSMSFYTKGGPVKVVSLKVHALADTWNERKDSGTRIVMDTSGKELGVGQSQTLYAAVECLKCDGSKSEKKRLKWVSSNPSVVRLNSSEQGKATLFAGKPGEAVIKVSTPDGKAFASTVVRVYDGKFVTNLTDWKPDLSQPSWIVTESGIRGSYSSDANYIAQETAGNFSYSADMRLGENGGAGSILFRASSDGRSGYYFNLDPNMKAYRLFYKADGAFEDRMVLARVPAFLERGVTYHVNIEAHGPHIIISVNGQSIIDVQDGTFAEGHFGVNVFGGQASYQNVMAANREEADLTSAVLVNEATGKTLYVKGQQNGEPVTVQEEGTAEWTFVPTGDEHGSYSIRAEGGKTLDLNTGQNTIQLYTYLGYNNQRWIASPNANGTVTITSVHNGKALEVSEDGSAITLNDAQAGLARQEWRMKQN